MLDKVVAGWQEVKWIWQMRQNCIAQFIQLLKRCLWNILLGLFMEIWAHSVDQCWLQALNFSVHLINLLSMLLRCNGFTRIQKAVVDQTSIRPPNSDHDLSFHASALELLLSPTTEVVITSCHIKPTFHHMSQSDQEMVHCCCCIDREGETSKWQFKKTFQSAHEAPTYQAFSTFQFSSNAEWL